MSLCEKWVETVHFKMFCKVYGQNVFDFDEVVIFTGNKQILKYFVGLYWSTWCGLYFLAYTN